MARRRRRLTDQDPAYRSRPDCMNHLERLQLVTAPLPTARKIPGKSWGGCYIKSGPIPETGGRAYVPSLLDDEELVKTWFAEVGAVWRDRVGPSFEELLSETLGRAGKAS